MRQTQDPDTTRRHIAELQVMIDQYGLMQTARMVFEAHANDPDKPSTIKERAISTRIRQAMIGVAIEQEGLYSVLEDVSISLESVANEAIDDDTSRKSAILEWEDDVFSRLIHAFDLNEETDNQEKMEMGLAKALISAAKTIKITELKPVISEGMPELLKKQA